MADTTTQTTGDPVETTQPADQTPKPDSELANELNKLGDNINALLKSMWDSEQRKGVEQQITTGLEQMNKQLNKAIDQVKSDTSVKKAKSGIKEAWTTAHGPQILTELKAGLSDTLKALNQELNKAAAPKPAVEVKPTEDGQAVDTKMAEPVVKTVEDVKTPEA